LETRVCSQRDSERRARIVICVWFSYDLEIRWKWDCVVQRETEKALSTGQSFKYLTFILLSSSSGDCQTVLPGSCSGNTVDKWVVFGFQNSTRLIIGSGSC